MDPNKVDIIEEIANKVLEKTHTPYLARVRFLDNIQKLEIDTLVRIREDLGETLMPIKYLCDRCKKPLTKKEHERLMGTYDGFEFCVSIRGRTKFWNDSLICFDCTRKIVASTGRD